MGLKRGDVLIAAVGGDYGKPRPYVVVQNDELSEIGSVILCPISSDIQGASFRLSIAPTEDNGLTRPSEVMVDKLQAVRRDRIGKIVGHLGPQAMSQLDGLISFALGLRG